jgi:L-threonylcarbamoyladenylate synthase
VLSDLQAEELDACLAAGGVALFGADTVYGLACDAHDERALQRIYELKGRDAGKPAAVMFLDLRAAREALPGLGPRVRAVLAALLPGPVTLLLDNSAGRFPLAGGSALGLRVPAPGISPCSRAILQTSANPAGGTEARRLEDVDPRIRAAVDLELDGGELTGKASTVVDLTHFERDAAWNVVRRGAVEEADVAHGIDSAR